MTVTKFTFAANVAWKFFVDMMTFVMPPERILLVHLATMLARIFALLYQTP